MPAPRIRAGYDSLKQMARLLARESDTSKKTVQRIKRQTGTLQGGEWVGAGATKFYREMDGEVMPSLTRLVRALDLASRTTLKILQIMKQAEDEAARVLRGDGSGGAAGGGSAAGGAAGAGGGDGAEVPQWQQDNPLLVRNPNELFKDDYMRGLIGSEFQGAGPELGRIMDGLLGDPSGDELDGFLEDLANLRGRPVAEIQIEFEKFKEAQAQAAENNPEEPPPSLSGGGHPSFMGSNTQMRYGSVVGDALGIDPAFGAMLNPTGGLVGPGNFAIAGDDTAVGYHGVVHDAAGYLYNYHDTGPGYDYLGTEGRSTASPLSGQRDGIAYWRGATGGPSPISTPAEYVMRGVVGVWDSASSVLDSGGYRL